jgi:hypothetical protein
MYWSQLSKMWWLALQGQLWWLVARVLIFAARRPSLTVLMDSLTPKVQL